MKFQYSLADLLLFIFVINVTVGLSAFARTSPVQVAILAFLLFFLLVFFFCYRSDNNRA